MAIKSRLNQHRNTQGSVLLIAMGITFTLGLSLAGYLTLARWQHVSVVRSQAWNGAMAMAEAGVEEAMAQLNPSALIFTNLNPIDRGANGWKLLADGLYHADRRTLPDLVAEYQAVRAASVALFHILPGRLMAGVKTLGPNDKLNVAGIGSSVPVWDTLTADKTAR